MRSSVNSRRLSLPPHRPFSSGGRHDPLADLARIVGQDDPFEALLANERTRGARAAKARAAFRDPRPVRPGTPTALPAHASQPLTISTIRSNPRPSTCNRPMRISSRSLLCRPATSSTPTIKADTTRAGMTPEYYDDNGHAQAEPVQRGGLRSSRSWTLPQRRPRARRDRWRGRARLRRGFHVQRRSAAISSGEPPLIAASNEPIKVAPQNPGGVEIPNQNKQIYERAQSGETKVVTQFRAAGGREAGGAHGWRRGRGRDRARPALRLMPGPD